jgi:hypothetical protein
MEMEKDAKKLQDDLAQAYRGVSEPQASGVTVVQEYCESPLWVAVLPDRLKSARSSHSHTYTSAPIMVAALATIMGWARYAGPPPRLIHNEQLRPGGGE